MDENQFQQGRRDFIKKIALATFTATGAFHNIAAALGSSDSSSDSLRSVLDQAFVADDEFHFFQDNGANLHFYFLNAKITTTRRESALVPISGAPSFMIVRLPQQHLTEELFNIPDSKSPTAAPEGRLSGFSYLAFRLFPEPEASAAQQTGLPPSRKKVLRLSSETALLDWNNPAYFELILPIAENFKKFASKEQWTTFCANKELEVIEEAGQTALTFYRQACDSLFVNAQQVRDNKDTVLPNFPITLLEIPEGLLVTPYRHNKPVDKVNGRPTRKAAEGGATPGVATKSRVRFPVAGRPRRYVYAGGTGRIYRSVEEIWNTRMWFEHLGVLTNPQLRAAGFIDRAGDTVVCPPPPKGSLPEICDTTPSRFLPTLLDKKEIVFLTGLGLKPGEPQSRDGEEWSIHTDALHFTALGAIARYRYHNMEPPAGSSLVEYEHRIAFGRDEFIKVSRIGVCSASAERLIHVHIGERVIRDGKSYMVFRQYIKRLIPKITYSEPAPAAPNDVPDLSYARAQLDPTGEHPGLEPYQFIDNPAWHDDLLIKAGYVPKNWKTHTRRFPFRRVSVSVLQSPLIDSTDSVKGCTGCGTTSPSAFWPLLADTKQDFYQDFQGVDWSGQAVNFSAPFLFVRKDIIDLGGTDEGKKCIKALYDEFFAARNQGRRTIRIGRKVSLTPNYDPPGGELPNRSNNVDTVYYEYCFGLAQGKVADNESLFNKRLFPLAVQLLKGKVLISNIQEYSSTPLHSEIEYNPDYIAYGFFEKALARAQQQLAGNDLSAYESSADAYNKAKLIFDHTDNFLKNAPDLDTDLKGGYAKIRDAYRRAGERIGGLVDPDYEIETIGLVKQGLGFGKGINAKYHSGAALLDRAAWQPELPAFNLKDLFRKSPQLFNGFSLLDVVQEVLPAAETPFNEIKEFAEQLQALLADNPVLKTIQEARDLAKSIKEKYDAAATSLKDIQRLEQDLKQRFDALSQQFRIAEILDLVRLRTDEYQLDLDKFVAQPTNAAIEQATRVITSSLIARLGQINRLPEAYQQARRTMENVRKLAQESRNEALKTVLSAFEAVILPAKLEDSQVYLLLELLREKPLQAGLKKFDDLCDPIRTLTQTTGEALAEVNQASQRVAQELAQLSDIHQKLDEAQRKLITDRYNVAQLELNAAVQRLDAIKISNVAIRSLRANKQAVVSLLADITSKLSKEERAKFAAFDADVLLLQSQLLGYYDALLRLTLPYLLEVKQTAHTNYLIARDKVSTVAAQYGETFITDIEANFASLQNKIVQQTHDLQDRLSNAFNPSRPLNEVELLVSNVLKNFEDGIQQQTRDIIITGNARLNALFNSPEIATAKREIERAQTDYKAAIKRYEELLRQQASNAQASLVDQVKAYIAQQEQLLRDRFGEDLTALQSQIAAARQVLNLLQTVTKKETRFSWQTTSLKNIDLGIIAFKALDAPKSALHVDVVNTITFAPTKFPAVVQDVAFSAENRVTNFGISLMKSLTIYFQEVSYATGTYRKPAYDVKIREVKFEGAFAFVQAFEKYLASLLGDAFRLQLLPTSVNVGYTLPLPAIQSPAFSFFNLTLNFDFWLHFTKKPMELDFSLGRRDSKFGIAAGPYAGFGYFSLVAEPKRGITLLEVGLEFGGYYSIGLGPLRGYVKLVVGLQYIKTLDVVEIAGYLLCEGRVKLWIAMITVSFYVEVRSRNGAVEGSCVAVLEVRITRFFKRAFHAHYYKKLHGATPGNSQAAQDRHNKLVKLAHQIRKTAEANRLSADQEKRIAEVSSPPELPYEHRLLTQDEWGIFLDSFTSNG